MKTKNKTKYKNLMLAIGLTFCVGAVTMAVDQNNKYEESQAVMYYSDSECKLTAEECNNIEWNYKDTIENLTEEQAEETVIKYNNKTFEYSFNEENNQLVYQSQDLDQIKLVYSTIEDNKILYYSEEETEIEEFTTDLYFNNAKWFVDYLKESTIKLTTSQLNIGFEYYADKFAENTEQNSLKVATTYIIYENNKYYYDALNSTDYQYHNDDTEISIFFNFAGNNKGKYTADLNETEIQINSEIKIYNAQFILENLNAPFESGDITENIASGLGLIGSLANTFLTGFAGLFWNSTANTLTVFGIFSLVFLGIAITFAVVKLCLNLIRSNTGV